VAHLFLDQHVCFLYKLFSTPIMCNRMLVHSNVNGCFMNRLKFMQNIKNLVVTIINARRGELQNLLLNEKARGLNTIYPSTRMWTNSLLPYHLIA
jgi:hypothetical protein